MALAEETQDGQGILEEPSEPETSQEVVQQEETPEEERVLTLHNQSPAQ